MRKIKTLPTFKNAKLTDLARGTGRTFPRFCPGVTSTASYAREYFRLNHRIRFLATNYTPDHEFFAPLCTEPAAMYDPAQPEVMREALDDAGQWVLV